LRKILKKTSPISILTGAFFLCFGSILAQETPVITKTLPTKDTISLSNNLKTQILEPPNDTLLKIDSIKVIESKKHKYRSPKKATIYSAILPGLGQAYNRKYWKIPIIYVAAGVIYYYYDLNNSYYLKYKDLYITEVNKETGKDQSLVDLYAHNRDLSRKWRDWNIIYMGILYAANIIDAMADAYFSEFDISDDLTMKIAPAVTPSPTLAFNGYAYGLKVSFSF
jgi:hypothetical protein